ncbi:hypothetical protein D0Z03_000223 [Geotrichum reessii]|nr:hypothetical protein D0Z03_000223 [Galactomyces reessii]
MAVASDSSCASLYYQCGGLNWKGATCCEAGSSCKVQNDYYHQCVKDTESDSAASVDDSQCQSLYQQCGGKEYTGSTCCQSGATCQVVNDWYYQCLPSTGLSHTHANTASETTQVVAVDVQPSQVSVPAVTQVSVPAVAQVSSDVVENSSPAPVKTSVFVPIPVESSKPAAPVSSSKALTSSVSKPAAPENQFSFNPIAGGKSGTGKTTRYWDCCKPSCSWSGKADVSSPVAACGADGKTISGVNDQSGCNGGNSYMCSNQQPFAINSTLAFGFVAASMAGYGESNMCCTCVLLTFNEGPAAGKQMVAQITNTGSDLGTNHFDIAMPGGGFGIFADGCPKQWNSPASNWGQTYGGVSSANDCKNLPAELQAGCDWRFNFLENADNPSVSFVEIECPSQITDITGCKRK